MNCASHRFRPFFQQTGETKTESGTFLTLVASCLERLPPEDVRVLTRGYPFNASYNEMAADLGLEPVEVKERVARARAALRLLLAQTCSDFAPVFPLSFSLDADENA